MANGKIRFGKQSGGELALVIPDGVDNTEVIIPESGVLAKTSDINTAGVELKTIAIGTATFTATTNNINLTGIGVGLEIGDVIQISGAEDAKNNSEFTVEVITDANNIIVNQAHANKGTVKNVATRVGNTSVTVKLLAKWYNAPIGLGQDWVMASRIADTVYYNNTNRKIEVAIYGNTSEANRQITIKINNVSLISDSSSGINYGGVYGSIPSNSNYSLGAAGTGTFIVDSWAELR